MALALNVPDYFTNVDLYAYNKDQGYLSLLNALVKSKFIYSALLTLVMNNLKYKKTCEIGSSNSW